MSFSSFATLTISTKRPPAVSSGKRSAPVTYLESVKVFPLLPPDVTLGGSTTSASVINRSGLPGQAIEMIETYAEYQTHTKSSVSVTEIPDIKEGDIIVDGSNNYEVKFVSSWPATDLTGFIRVVLEENKIS